MSSKNAQFELMQLQRKSLSSDPFRQFDVWYAEAVKSRIKHADAFVLSTVAGNGVPSSRVVLYKGRDGRGFKFYTNMNSRKGQELKNNNRASLCFWWNELERQVRIEGAVESMGSKESDVYFQTRPRGSQIGAWASDQSNVIKDREELEERYRYYENKFAGTEVPRPEYWKGYIVVAEEFEFWQGRKNRLHDRFRYRLENHNWIIERMAP